MRQLYSCSGRSRHARSGPRGPNPLRPAHTHQAQGVRRIPTLLSLGVRRIPRWQLQTPCWRRRFEPRAAPQDLVCGPGMSEMALIASGPYHCHSSAGIAVVRTTGYKSHF
eukprot:363051-Chlamydomonas_euryale.AAC.4